MIQISSRAMRIVPYTVVWFAAKPNLWGCLLKYYKQSKSCDTVAGYRKEAFFTKVIDISAPVTAIEANFDKNTAYEIRRAAKDGVTSIMGTGIKPFIEFYNSFALTKGLKKLNKDFYKYKPHLFITKAVHQGQDIVMHAYIRDNALQRVRLLHSASLFRNENDTQLKAVAGRANRLLHFDDICFFKQLGFKIYDLGGYAHDTKDTELLKINKFKDSFGGTLLQETDYVPISLTFLSLLKKIFRV
ncbi:hypothetical protein SAMN05216464_102497 [Mucilaginibacter pineti]|uniref:FemAB family protein n=1 Tax=Mucilaginibacter pineti TaxID=1391627 RepID=A0A1G6XDU2_9SPHI|nr:hypothetical protein [Mucilaginibacter pineti]SDD76222.1 hypothetical protein SAMN05216464_102497 [Mucilaginibacter pineti]